MIVYLAGPAAGTTDEEAHGWRAQVRRTLEAQGHAVLDPMVRDYRNGWPEGGAAQIVREDKRDIEQSDAVLAYCWQPSVGTSMEIYFAHYMRKQVVIVVGSIETASPWLVAHCDFITDSMPRAIDYLLDDAR